MKKADYKRMIKQWEDARKKMDDYYYDLLIKAILEAVPLNKKEQNETSKGGRVGNG